jgi:hypothetical protein
MDKNVLPSAQARLSPGHVVWYVEEDHVLVPGSKEK